MKKTIKIKALGICCLALIMQGCSYRFQPGPKKFQDEENGALVVQAENNLLGIYDNWETYCEELEEDSYGRKMYVFRGKSDIAIEELNESNSYIWAILIQQKKEDGYVYYYEDISYILRDFNFNVGENHDKFIDKTIGSLSDSEINKLKEENDWDKEYNEEKMIKKEIINFGVSYKNKIVDKKRQEQVFANHFLGRYPKSRRFYTYLTSDDYGRHIYFCRTIDEKERYDHSYLVMFYGTEDYKILELSNVWDYRDEIIEFKKENNWGKPVE